MVNIVDTGSNVSTIVAFLIAAHQTLNRNELLPIIEAGPPCSIEGDKISRLRRSDDNKCKKTSDNGGSSLRRLQ